MTGKEFVDKVFMIFFRDFLYNPWLLPILKTICFHHLVSRQVVHVYFMRALFTFYRPFYHVAQRASFQPITFKISSLVDEYLNLQVFPRFKEPSTRSVSVEGSGRILGGKRASSHIS